MIWIVLANCAFADTPSPWDGGFVSPARDDAPVDGVLVYAANFVPEAMVVAGPGAPFALDATLLTGVGAPPSAALWPPDGGWEPGATYTVAVGTSELTFTVGQDPTGEADALEVGEIGFGDWTDDQPFVWGCCSPTRQIEVPVEVPGADRWAWVEIVGAFDLGGPSQITTDPAHTHLDLVLGPGPHVLSFTQWVADELPQPPCFDVVTVSAAGVAGAVETFCTDELGLVIGEGGAETIPTDEQGPASQDGAEPTGCGCAQGGTMPALLAPLWFLVYRRREGRDESSRK